MNIRLVTVDNENAAVVRATFSPQKLAEFINNPKIMGVSFGDDDTRELDKVKSMDDKSSENE